MNTEILNLFLDLAKAGEKVRLFNTYKGLPISFEAEFIKISRGMVTFKVHRYQALCIKKTGYSIIRHDLFPNPMQASALQVDFVEMNVILHDFQFINASAGNRQMIRVEPEKTFTVVLTNGAVVNSETADISESGFGVYIKTPYYTERNFGLEKLINLEFRFPQEKRLVGKMKGVIANVNANVSEERFRLGIRTFPDNEAQRLINSYISVRQADIVKELDTLHHLVQKNIS